MNKSLLKISVAIVVILSTSTLFGFEGNAGERVVLDLRSVNFDTYLMLMHDKKKVAEFDSGKGGAKDSRIRYRAKKSGQYVIVAKGYITKGTGLYNLRFDAR